MGRRSEFTAEERVEIVLALLRREEPMSVLAKRHGVSETSLGRWRDEFIAAGTDGLARGTRRKAGETRAAQRLEAEIVERDRVIGELTIANRVLKKNGLSRA